MSMAALLARLNPSQCNLDRITGGSAPEISDHDVAAALGMAKIPDTARALVRAKWAKQDNAIRPLHIGLYEAIEAEGGDNWRKLKSHRPGLIFDLTRLAVIEYCNVDTCYDCHGTKEAKIGGRVLSCPSCNGTGMIGRQDSDRKRANKLGIAESTYRRIWSELMTRCYEILSGWEGLALTAARHRIFGD